MLISYNFHDVAKCDHHERMVPCQISDFRELCHNVKVVGVKVTYYLLSRGSDLVEYLCTRRVARLTPRETEVNSYLHK